MAESTTPTNATNFDSMVGRIVVERGLATAEDVQRARDARRESSGDSDVNQKSLGEVLVAQGVVTPKQLERLRPEMEERRAGRQIPGYQILSKLGAGAMATVYKARQISLDRLVAIKVLPQKYTNNPQFIERFYAEGKAAAKLNHPHIVQAYDVGQAGDFHYFVMEYVDGKSVFDDITQKGAYDEKTALKLVIETARALSHAHDKGFIHRDVKPKNIMITKDGKAKLADMGLARAVSDREAAEAEAGKAYGTPYYISPEQVRGEVGVDFRADIYSLGATMYHMVTGRVPFDGSNPSAVMHQHLKGELVPPDHINPNLSSGISEIVEVCMARDRERRYATTADLLEDLEAVQRGEPPMQARKVFDINTLSTLDAPGGAARGGQSADRLVSLPTHRLDMSQPIFWVALVGWVLAIALLFALVLTLSFTGS